ncbi:hypothetical protein O4J56_13730 [Nocardiopsis sp. RSe5-2]|uniref:Uncharacterized protein n=1 Tax=Nocardiopsis endophytica TaxID=3018445 RepID=A0ABT4U420_9ACTN|nr:hypothetical protein [Nocardiopsis endophytica]MDA2811696.1 hypothetical protein [Nocardiopsis endophytica]
MRTDGDVDTREVPADPLLAFARRLVGAQEDGRGGGTELHGRVHHARLRVLGVPALLLFRPDPAEVRRRAETGQPPILRMGALEALMGLPLGEPVPERTLTERERCLLRAAPHAALRRDGPDVVRLAAVPLRVEMVVVEAPTWRTALRRVGRFPPTSARVAVAGRPPKDGTVAACEADFYGIGLGARCDDGAAGDGGGDGGARSVRPLVAPSPGLRRHTAVTWRFAELVLAGAEEAGVLASAAPGAGPAPRPDP